MPKNGIGARSSIQGVAGEIGVAATSYVAGTIFFNLLVLAFFVFFLPPTPPLENRGRQCEVFAFASYLTLYIVFFSLVGMEKEKKGIICFFASYKVLPDNIFTKRKKEDPVAPNGAQG